MRVLKFQIGQFFLVIGVIMLAIFFVTGQSQSPQFLLFFGGVLIAGAGISLMMRNRTAFAGDSARFRRVRHYRQKARERREKKRQKLQERRER
jgi:cell shape-determining protein MreC